VLAAGQIEGGVAQAIGFTLFENVVWKDGRMANNQMTNYIIPTPADIPTDSRLLRREPVRVWTRRRERNRRATDGRRRPGDSERD
jgi:xanthine dehydrogenase molybdopterin-binding subunit B